MEDYISVYEYEKNVNPILNTIPFHEKNIDECDYGITIVDFSKIFNVSHRSTTPNLLASFIKITNKESLKLENSKFANEFNQRSQTVKPLPP
jgi:hypothetical protein